MKRILIPLLIAVLICFGIVAAAEGDTLAIEAPTAQINEGETMQVSLTREGAAAEGELTYMSSDKRIATVDENGVVTAVKKGRAVITASVKADKKTFRAQLKLTVIKPVTSLSVNTAKLPVYAPTDKAVAEYLTDRGNAEENELSVLLIPVKKRFQITAVTEPKDASSHNIVLSGDGSAAFTIQKGAVAGTEPGEGILTVASESNPEVFTRYRVLVVQPVTKVTVTASAPTVTVGGQATVTAEAMPENATVKQVVWSSGDERIIKVDENGTVTGVKRGNGRIIATAADGSNVRANFSMRVVQNPEKVTLNAESMTIDVGRTAVARAVVEPKDTDNKKVIWTTSDESIATVSKDGRIKAVSVGDCTLTCTCEALDTVTASMTVHVQQPVKKVTFNAKKALVYVDETTQLTWTIEPADATNPALTFKSSNERAVTVDENGVVTGVSSGKANVDATTTDGSRRKARILVQAGRHVSGVRMIRRHAYIDVGETATAGAIISPKDAINTNMSWSSSDDGIVTANGNSNKKMKLKGIRKGDATVTGVTEDGGYETSIRVTVGEFDKALSFKKLNYDKNAYFWLTIQNDSKLTITQITAEVEMFDASESDKPKVKINTKNGSNKVNLVWTGTLRPGESTGKNNWKMVNFKLKSPHISDTCGTVTLTEFQIENDWIKLIRNRKRVQKKFGY